MNDEIRKTLSPIKNFWANTSKGIRKLIITGTITVIIVALVISFALNSKDYVVIFEQLTETETSEILAKLQEMEVGAKVDGAGSIMVSEKEESSVRMALATEGYPKSGLSYYLIEQASGMLTTDYEREQYVSMQLQERIAASIKTLEGVRDAIVTITTPNNNVFYLQEKEKPSASVIIHMKKGESLSDGQVLGIQNLVVKSVSGLSKDNVAISDSSGNDLTGNSSSNVEEFSKISVTREIENDIRKKITTVLQGPYDNSQFRISVTATVDMDDLIKEETLYSPSPDGENTGVISSETNSEETSESSQGDGGVAGTSGNSEIPVYPSSVSSGESSSSSSSQSTTYQVSQIISQFQKTGAKIESVSIGIAIDKVAFEPGERERISRLVAFAAGVDTSSITVENFVFYSPDESPALPVQGNLIEGNKLFTYAGIGAAILLITIIFIIIFFIKRQNHNKTLIEIQSSEAATTGESLDELFGHQIDRDRHTPPEGSKIEEITKFTKDNPEIVAQMIRAWLKNEQS